MKSDLKPDEKIVLDYSQPKALLIRLCGNWLVSESIPLVDEVILKPGINLDIAKIIFDSSELSDWDSVLVSFVLRLSKECRSRKINVSTEGLPQGVQKLLTLALVENKNYVPKKIHEQFFARIGDRAIAFKEDMYSVFNFLGDIIISSRCLLRKKCYFRREEFLYIMQRCGVDALPLISLISILIGVILAFVGVVQLKMFGAQVYIADIVGISMVRVMGAIMTAILMTGRTGASFTAELAIMQTNEEIDAFETLGVNPVNFLVVPRVLALIIMLPLLTIYADFMGILGGFIVSTGIFNIPAPEYIAHTRQAVTFTHVSIGLIHSIVFAIIIAVTACFRGIKCNRTAEGVGDSVTAAVVTGLIGIVIATAIITFSCYILGV